MRSIFKAFALGAGIAIAVPAPAAEPEKPLATVFKNPQCECCESYAEYLRENGYPVKVVATHELPLINERQGIALGAEGCHTTLIGGYFVSGHVPIGSFDRLLEERPDVNGITLPGMPMGSPGMGGAKTEPFTIYAMASGQKPAVYAVE